MLRYFCCLRKVGHPYFWSAKTFIDMGLIPLDSGASLLCRTLIKAKRTPSMMEVAFQLYYHCEQLLILLSSSHSDLNPKHLKIHSLPDYYELFSELYHSTKKCPVRANLVKSVDIYLLESKLFGTITVQYRLCLGAECWISPSAD